MDNALGDVDAADKDSTVDVQDLKYISMLLSGNVIFLHVCTLLCTYNVCDSLHWYFTVYSYYIR